MFCKAPVLGIQVEAGRQVKCFGWHAQNRSIPPPQDASWLIARVLSSGTQSASADKGLQRVIARAHMFALPYILQQGRCGLCYWVGAGLEGKLQGKVPRAAGA